MVDLTKPMKMGAFVDFNRTRKYSEDDYILPETPPFSWLLRKQDGGDANNNSNNNNTSTETVTGVPATEDLSSTTTATTTTTTMCNKENENKNVDSRNSNNTGSGGVGKRPFGSNVAAEESKVFSSKQRPSRWSVSPTLDEEKFLKELVS